MAYPDFSEFSFGYAAVRQFEQLLGARIAVPSFPTQRAEADGGYDVDFLSHGMPLFIQFKRSEVMRRKSCQEYRLIPSAFRFPIYRMHLHSRYNYRQHSLMQHLERRDCIAIYCTSAVANKRELDEHYRRDAIFDASAFFRPSEIVLPTLHENHHVSFNVGSTDAYVFSGEGSRFERGIKDIGRLIDKLRNQADVPVSTQVEKLASIDEDLDGAGADEIADGMRHQLDIAPSYRSEGDEYFEGFAVERDAYRNIANMKSVVKRVALRAYLEMDAMLMSVSREVLAV